MINLSPPAGRCFLLVIQFAVIAMSGRGDGLRQAKTVQLSPPGKFRNIIPAEYGPAPLNRPSSQQWSMSRRTECSISPVKEQWPGSIRTACADLCRPPVPSDSNGLRRSVGTRSRFVEAMICDQTHTHPLFPGCFAFSNNSCVHASTLLRASRQSAASSLLS